MSKIFNSNRMGRFTIDIAHIRSKSKMVSTIMSEVIPIKVVHYTDEDILEYLAISAHFDELKDDEVIPTVYIPV